MGGKILSGCRIYIGYPIPAWKAKTNDWSNAKVTRWVKNAGGTVQQQFNELTATHLVIDENQWQNKTRVVQTALDANENGHKVQIVSPAWLENCLEEQRKCREGTYLWEKLDQVASSGKQKKRGKPSSDEEGGSEGSCMVRKAPQAMLGEVFQESTEPFVEERDRRAYEAELAGKLKAKKEREEAEARAKEVEKIAAEQKRRERAEIMRKTVKRGRGQVFNENYHAWSDSTGFSYDIMLTRVDTLTNSNERINLTIFETNEKPRTYATNLHFAGTGKCPMNNILAAIGSNQVTAMRMFRKAFLEKTGCDWDDRIKAHNERVRARERDGDTPNQFGMRRGEEGGIKSKARAAEDATPFEKRAFEYMPPLHAARGLLPDGRDEVPEVVKQMRAMPHGRKDRHLPVQIDLTDEEPTSQPSIPLTTDDGNIFDSNITGASVETFDFNELFAGTSKGSIDPLSIPVTTTEGAALDGAMTGANANPFDIEHLLGGASEWVTPATPVTATQDAMFDATALSGGQHPQFVFDQDEVNLGGMPFETQVNQTQLATGIGEDLLNLNNDQSATFAHASKRKRDDDSDDVEEEATVAKKLATENEG